MVAQAVNTDMPESADIRGLEFRAWVRGADARFTLTGTALPIVTARDAWGMASVTEGRTARGVDTSTAAAIRGRVAFILFQVAVDADTVVTPLTATCIVTTRLARVPTWRTNAIDTDPATFAVCRTGGAQRAADDANAIEALAIAALLVVYAVGALITAVPARTI